jgi:hypothetical protein
MARNLSGYAFLENTPLVKLKKQDNTENKRKIQ